MLEQGLAEASAAPRLQAVIHARLAENGYFGLRDRVPFVARHARASLRLAEQLDDDALRVSALDLGDRPVRKRASRRVGAGRACPPPRSGAQGSAAREGCGWAVGHVLTWTGESDRARWLERRLAEWDDRDERARTDSPLVSRPGRAVGRSMAGCRRLRRGDPPDHSGVRSRVTLDYFLPRSSRSTKAISLAGQVAGRASAIDGRRGPGTPDVLRDPGCLRSPER